MSPMTMQGSTRKKMKKWHDRCIVHKTFKEGDRVLLFNSRLRIFPRNLNFQWTGRIWLSQSLYLVLLG